MALGALMQYLVVGKEKWLKTSFHPSPPPLHIFKMTSAGFEAKWGSEKGGASKGKGGRRKGRRKGKGGMGGGRCGH